MATIETSTLGISERAAPISEAQSGVPARSKRWVVTLLGALLFAQGLGKALALSGYLSALAAFDALPAAALGPVGVAWMMAELLSGLGLLATGLLLDPPRHIFRWAAVLALVIAGSYALLTTQAYLRGLDVANCTCFGVYLAQRLSWFVLAQDAYMLLYARWVLRKTYIWIPT